MQSLSGMVVVIENTNLLDFFCRVSLSVHWQSEPGTFFWGSFDLAVTRYSGRPAPTHPGVPYVARFVMVEAYSHEVVVVSGLVAEPLMNLLSMLIPILRLRTPTPNNLRRHSTRCRWENSCYISLTKSCIILALVVHYVFNLG